MINSSSPQDYFITACPGCGKRYRMLIRSLGKEVHCKHCQTRWKSSVYADSSFAQGDTSELTGTDHSHSGSQLNVNSSTANGTSIDDDVTWIGKRLGRFQIVDILGKGAMGVVFRAHDPDLKRDVALKILAKQFIRSQKKTYRLEQFVREARSAARLSHAHTVTVFEIGQDQGWYFIAMELVEGKTLLDLVRRMKKRVPVEYVCELIAQAADALSAAHRLGIIHRDIKPSNLMLTSRGQMKVADFGLAQLEDTDDDFDLPTKAVGTPYWMSPEQIKNQTAIPASDVYSLGAVLFFALTGEVPYKGRTKKEILSQHVSTAVPDPRNYRKEIPDSLVRIIQKAMAKNPAERYQNAGEMAIGLRQLASALQQSKIAEKWWGKLASTGSINPLEMKRKNTLSTILMAVVLIAILVSGFAVWHSHRSSGRNGANSAVESSVKVYAIPGRYLYHDEACDSVKDVPKEKLLVFPNAKEAEKQGYNAHKFCEQLLKEREEKAAKK